MNRIGLMDIAPDEVVSESVKVAKHEVAVYGISAEGIAYLLQRFPPLQRLLEGREVKGLTPEVILKMIPDAVAAIIAAGTGYPGDAKAEERARRLPLTTQTDFLEKVIRLTVPEGIGPLMERLMAMGALVSLENVALGTDPVMKSPKRSRT